MLTQDQDAPVLPTEDPIEVGNGGYITSWESSALVALARVPVCPWIGVVPVCPCARGSGCARVPVCPGQRQVQKSRSPEVARLQAVAICLLVPQTVSPH